MARNEGRKGNKPLNGNGEPNELTGELGKANQINGGGNDDTITGGDQIDYINAGGGDDFILGDPGADEEALEGGTILSMLAGAMTPCMPAPAMTK